MKGGEPADDLVELWARRISASDDKFRCAHMVVAVPGPKEFEEFHATHDPEGKAALIESYKKWRAMGGVLELASTQVAHVLDGVGVEVGVSEKKKD